MLTKSLAIAVGGLAFVAGCAHIADWYYRNELTRRLAIADKILSEEDKEKVIRICMELQNESSSAFDFMLVARANRKIQEINRRKLNAKD